MNFKRISGNKKGVMLPLVSILLAFVVFGVAALVVDAGMIYAEKKSMVTAADAAALAGAQTLQKSTGVNIPKAKQVAENCALSNGANTVSVVVKDILNPGDKNKRKVNQINAPGVKKKYFSKTICFEKTYV